MFAATGLGKSRIQLEWARHVAKHGRVLILAPLAVAEQTVREGQSIGIETAYRRSDCGDAITVTNYEILHAFDPSQFAGVVLDESSILKAYDGKTRAALIEAFSATRFRLCCTATPAPNDYTELGNHSQFLGIKSYSEMLSTYFTNGGETTQQWRLKGHAQDAFWRWVCSWAAVVNLPSDLGHDDGDFRLPPLRVHEHVIEVDNATALRAGKLFADDVHTLSDQRATRRATLEQRVEIAKRLASKTKGSVIVWCELNAESDAIEKAIPGAVQVAGSDSVEDKCDRLLGFAEGRYRVLVTKASVAGFGLNFQVASTQVFAGVTHSFEAYWQAVRRSWRFGQRRPVDVHVIRASTEGAIVQNLRRKEADADRLSTEMVALVRETTQHEIRGSSREYDDYNPIPVVVPGWVRSRA